MCRIVGNSYLAQSLVVRIVASHGFPDAAISHTLFMDETKGRSSLVIPLAHKVCVMNASLTSPFSMSSPNTWSVDGDRMVYTADSGNIFELIMQSVSGTAASGRSADSTLKLVHRTAEATSEQIQEEMMIAGDSVAAVLGAKSVTIIGTHEPETS